MAIKEYDVTWKAVYTPEKLTRSLLPDKAESTQ